MATTNGAVLAMAGSTNNKTADVIRATVSSDMLGNRNPWMTSSSSRLLSCPLLKSRRNLKLTVGLNKVSLLPILCNTAKEPPASVLRRILASPGLHQGPACHDALSAKLIENAGFTLTFMSGFSVSASRLALPDTGLISYGEMVEQGGLITSAVSIPVIGDADNGYGNALNVKRTVKGYIKAGFGGILLEDQVSPKACGHTKGRKVISREEAVMRIKAAVDARAESSNDLVIVGRTDARQAISMEEALWRAQAMADAGADVIFADALCSKDELRSICRVAAGTPKMANMLEGGGKTPILSPEELEELGFKIVSYPLSLIGVSISAMQDALLALKSGRMPPPSDLPSFEMIKKVVGFDSYYEEESRYSISESSDLNTYRDTQASEFDPMESPIGVSSEVEREEVPPVQSREPDLIIPDIMEGFKNESPIGSSSKIWARTLRVKVTANNGDVKLNVRIPAGFLDGLAKIIPGVAGVNLASLLDESAHRFEGNLTSGQELLDINDGRGDRIQIFLE